MIFNEKMIQSILEGYLWDKDIQQDGNLQCGFQELVEGVTIELNAMQNTERLLHKIREEETMYNEEHRLSIQKLEEDRDAVIKKCKHHSTTYDPGGSCANKPTNICDTCGVEVSCGE
jgi:hypothetical protein